MHLIIIRNSEAIQVCFFKYCTFVFGKDSKTRVIWSLKLISFFLYVYIKLFSVVLRTISGFFFIQIMVIVFPINLYTGIRCTSYSFRSIISRFIWYLFAFYIRAKNSDAPLLIFYNLRNLNISLKDVATIVCFLKCSTLHVKIL